MTPLEKFEESLSKLSVTRLLRGELVKAFKNATKGKLKKNEYKKVG